MINKYSNLENFMKSYITYDKELLARIKKFRLEWAIKRIDSSTSNIDFLSNITIGEQAVRFSTLDESMLANNALRVDLNVMQNDLYSVQGIIKEFNVSSNIINQIMVYLIREALLEGLDTEYIKELYYIMAYRMIGSLLSHTFSYPLDSRLAASLAENMSKKFILKEVGSWQKYFEYKASFLFMGTDHANRLMNNYSAETSILVINDIQTNIRSTFYRVYGLIVELSSNDIVIDNTTLTKMENEELVISDVGNSLARYSKQALEAIHGDFINDNYIYLISEISPNLNTTVFKSLLTNISKNSLEDFKDIDELVNDIIKQSIVYLIRIESVEAMSSNIIEVLRKLKSFYSSSKVSDSNITSIKERCMSLIDKNTTVKTSWILTSLNINLILYIVLLSLIKK